MRSRYRFLCVACLVPVGAAACGSKTGLLAGLEPDADVPPDAGHDVFVPFEAAPPPQDSGAEDAGEEDALPPIDVTPPPPFNDCPDAASTLIYVITEKYTLLSFYPPTGTFTTINTITCNTSTPGATPFSMAVDRTGIAYTIFNDGELFRVSTATAACQPTPFVSGQQGFAAEFGMAFSHDAVGMGETLYVASGSDTQSIPQLATIDTKTFQLQIIGRFNPSIDNAELTGTGAGDLFGFYQATPGAPDSFIAQIDKGSAQVLAQSTLSGVNQGNGWAFAFWGGDFYTFTAPPSAAGTLVTRFRPSDGSILQVAQFPELIVGAGVSTCAPQR